MPPARRESLKAEKALKEADQKERYLRAVASVGTLTAGCKAARVSPNTVYEWREHDATFLVREHQAREECADELEASVIRRAKGRSDTLAIFMLKGMRPAKYRDNSRVELTGEDGGPIAIDSDPYGAIESRMASLAARLRMAQLPREPVEN